MYIIVTVTKVYMFLRYNFLIYKDLGHKENYYLCK